MTKAGVLWGWFFGRPFLLLGVTAVMWGGNSFASRLAVGHLSPMALTFRRWLGVILVRAPFLGPSLLAASRALVPRWRYIIVMAALGFTFFNAMMYTGAQYTTAV